MANVVRRLVTAGVLVALVAPVAVDRDSFPLSTYPMYARQRPDTVAFTTAVGIDAEGDRQRLSLELIGRSDDPLIVSSLTRQAGRAGGEAAAILCADIANRVIDSSADLVSIEVVTETHNVVQRARARPSLVEDVVLAVCPVRSP